MGKGIVLSICMDMVIWMNHKIVDDFCDYKIVSSIR